jgi:DNA (cytosine-5)-methyltransferase 1
MAQMNVTAVDLFCGAGGFSTGLVAAGFRLLGAVDSWDVACRTYRRNFAHPVLNADIHNLPGLKILEKLGVPGASIDLVVGGPPCQGFSVQRIGEDLDPRNNLVHDFARLVLEFQPRMFLMENVPGLLGKRGRKYADHFERLLQSGGYGVRSVVANTAEFGLPQIRRRVFFYGWRVADVQPFRFPLPTHSRDEFKTVSDAISDLPSPLLGGKTDPTDPLHRRTHLSEKNVERLGHIPPGGGFESLPVELRANCHKNGAAQIGHRNVYGRLSPDAPASTITARFDSFTRGKFAHPFEDRNITLREGARLQTFPDKFQFEGTQEEIAALIGNAVPPDMAKIVATAVLANLLQPAHGTTVSSSSDLADQLQLFGIPEETEACPKNFV